MTTLQHLGSIAVVALSTCWSMSGFAADAWPTKPVVIIVPYQSGGSIDAMARPLAMKLSQVWKQPVIVDNRPGANGILATQAVIKAPADGHTLLYHITGVVQNPSLYKSARYDPLKDLTPIIQVGGQAMVLAVPEKSPYVSLGQLIAAGKAQPEGQSYGSVGMGHTGHIWSELLSSETGLKTAHAAYKGSAPMVVDLLSSRLDWAYLSTAEALVRINDKSVRGLAVTGPERLRQFPSLPTMKELGHPGFEMVGWHGIFGPAGLPPAVVRKIETDVHAALAEPDMAKVAEMQAMDITARGHDEFAGIVRADYDQWGMLIRKFKIRNE